MLDTARRKHKSSTATRVYQIAEWALVLSIHLLKDYEYSISNESIAWEILLLLSVLYITTTYSYRARWNSLLLWVVFFPQTTAWVKCRGSDMLDVNIQISVLSYLHQLQLPFSVELLGSASRDPFIAILHVQIIELGRALVGTSLNVIELALISHGFSAFTIYHLSHEHSMHETFLFSFLWGLLFAVYPAIPLIRANLRLARMKPHHRPKNVVKLRFTYALYAYIIIAVVILTAVRLYLIKQLRSDPFVYILNYIWTKHRILLTIYWATIAGSGIIIVIYFWGSKPVGGLSNFPNSALRLMSTITRNDHTEADEVFFEEEHTLARRARALDRRRKFFHGLVVVLFLPTINRDPQYSYLALSLALTAFIFEEVVRSTVLPPFGVAIHKFLSGFTDHRDKTGHIVVSHLFLLIGVSAPVWLTLTGEGDVTGSIAMLSGVLSLGAGDAAASIIGKKYGSHKWPTLPKSLEGTLAFVIAMMLGGLAVDYYGIGWFRFMVGSMMTGLMEAVSTQNDNLVIPVYMWCIIV